MNVRGRIVRLGAAIDRVLEAHGYPDAVSELTGEALTLVSLLGASLKFEGVLTLQTRSDGPVSMVVADFTTPGTVRACASFDKESILQSVRLPAALLGEGTFALTIDQGADMERHQGIVALDGQGLAASALSYFARSEQIPTALRVAVASIMDRDAQGVMRRHWRAGGIMIQNLAVLGGHAQSAEDDPEECWNRAAALLATTEDHELVDPQLEATRLLYRLFHEDGVRVFPAQALSFGCRCSRERVGRVLSSYSPQEMDDLAIDGAISATCEFCSATYRFTKEEAAQGSAE
jgi:molecular chaperone Hsp33